MAEYAVVLGVISITIMLALTSLSSVVAGRIQAITSLI
jgi:Flp pilus assembly pilin Flp